MLISNDHKLYLPKNESSLSSSSSSMKQRARKMKTLNLSRKRRSTCSRMCAMLGLTCLVSMVSIFVFMGIVEYVLSSDHYNKVGDVTHRIAAGGGPLVVTTDGLIPQKEKQQHIKDLLQLEEEEAMGEDMPDDDGDESKKGKLIDGVWIPKAEWPVSIRYEDGLFEEIAHPGDPESTMTVPLFWLDPVHEQKLMSREMALAIGSCASEQPPAQLCPLNDRTIFVAIASYRDWQCRHTLESIFNRAKFPNRVRVAVTDQIVQGEDVNCNTPIQPCADNPQQALCKYEQQIDVYTMDAELGVGPVFARHIGHRMYRGEYYSMQSDAHITFTQDWDTSIIQQHENTSNEMAVQTTYLTDVQGSIDEHGNSLRNTRPIMCNTDYEGGVQGKHLRHLSQPEAYPSIHGSPQLEPYWAAGFSFSRGHFVVNVPYDQYQPMIFQGEEMSIGIRGFTVGYDYYATERSICFHHYSTGKNVANREKVPKFWNNANKYKGTGIKAMKRLLGIVHMNPEVPSQTWDHSEEERYGLGGVRTTDQFYKTFGIDVVNKVTEHNLCHFVERGEMHRLFTKYLRPDHMGIDYDKINYQFHDPMKH